MQNCIRKFSNNPSEWGCRTSWVISQIYRKVSRRRTAEIQASGGSKQCLLPPVCSSKARSKCDLTETEHTPHQTALSTHNAFDVRRQRCNLSPLSSLPFCPFLFFLQHLPLPLPPSLWGGVLNEVTIPVPSPCASECNLWRGLFSHFLSSSLPSIDSSPLLLFLFTADEAPRCSTLPSRTQKLVTLNNKFKFW